MAFCCRGPVSRNSPGLHKTMNTVLPQQGLWMLQLQMTGILGQEETPTALGTHKARINKGRTCKARFSQFMTPATVASWRPSFPPAPCRLVSCWMQGVLGLGITGRKKERGDGTTDNHFLKTPREIVTPPTEKSAGPCEPAPQLAFLWYEGISWGKVGQSFMVP